MNDLKDLLLPGDWGKMGKDYLSRIAAKVRKGGYGYVRSENQAHAADEDGGVSGQNRS